MMASLGRASASALKASALLPQKKTEQVTAMKVWREIGCVNKKNEKSRRIDRSGTLAAMPGLRRSTNQLPKTQPFQVFTVTHFAEC
jgi:hypothetical protein